jgi:hypothetical protein
MIKFFRNIRQRLLIENPSTAKAKSGNPTYAKASAGKYLLYALGEIILVVVGILIALQINNWNENNKQTVNDIKFLNNLRYEIELDTSDFFPDVLYLIQ